MKEEMTMKKMITNMKALAALLMVGAAVTSCSSDDSIIDEPDAPQVYTMTVEASKGTNGTRALADGGTTLTSTWSVGDKVKVYNSSDAELGELTAQTNGVSTTLSGTLSSLPNNDETLTLKYLSPSYGTQDGTLTGSAKSIDKVCDYATATVKATVSGSSVTTTNASFVNQQAVVKFTLKDKADDSNLNATVLKVTADGNTYTVTPTSAASELYVAVPAISAKQVTLTAKVGSTYYDFGTTSATFENGNFYRITVKMSNGTLSGKFSVSATKQVYFSKGNLRYVSGAWSFFDTQDGYYNTYSADAWDKFGWVGNFGSLKNSEPGKWGVSTSTTDADYGAAYEDMASDWGNVPGIGTDWRTLTKAEWAHLFNTRTASTVNGTANARYAKAKVKDVHGVILFPDTYTHPDGVTLPKGINSASTNAGWSNNNYTEAAWDQMEAAGCVFLPAAGVRTGSSVNDVDGNSLYWSSTANKATTAWCVNFDENKLYACDSSNRYFGFSVRLVRDVVAP